jgi:RNA polymerase primary sigma factor
MDMPMGEDGDSVLGDMIEDPNSQSPFDNAISGSLREAINEALDALTPREAKILRLRYGLDIEADMTLEDVGKQFDVTRERIRQIEMKALRKLRHPSRADRLRTLLDAD